MTTEKYCNRGSTTLNGAVNASTTSLTVADGSVLPSAGNFRIIIDSEIFKVTARSSNVLTCAARPQESTTAAAHADGAVVRQVLTKGALDQIIADNIQRGAYASLPSAEKAGRLYLCSDAPYKFYDNGSSWNAYVGDQPATVPVLADWTLTNAKSGGSLATLTQASGGVYLAAGPDTADSFCMALKAIPAAPYTATFRLRFFLAGGNYCSGGVLWRRNANGFLKCLDFLFSSVFQVEVGLGNDGSPHITSDYTASGTATFPEWFRLVDDNTNEKFQVSPDGFNWVTVWSQARNTDLTQTHLGFFVNPRNSASMPASAILLSYAEA